MFLTIPAARASFVLSTYGQAVTEDFDDFRGAGFNPNPTAGQVDSDTYRAVGLSDGPGTFGGVHETGDFARGESLGGVSTGGVYAFQVAPDDYAIGVQPIGSDFTPGTFTIRVSNQTGRSIPGFQLSADGLFFNDQGRSSQWLLSVSLDDLVYQPLPLFLQSQETPDAMPAWVESTIPIEGFVPFPAPLPDGQDFFLQFTGDDLGGSGSRDEFALSRLSITAIPEPASAALLGVASGLIAFRRRRRIA